MSGWREPRHAAFTRVSCEQWIGAAALSPHGFSFCHEPRHAVWHAATDSAGSETWNSEACCRVHVALGIDAALSAHLRSSFEVVVLCHTFSEQEQLELARKLREQRPSIRVIIMDAADGGANYDLRKFLANVGGTRQST